MPPKLPEGNGRTHSGPGPHISLRRTTATVEVGSDLATFRCSELWGPLGHGAKAGETGQRPHFLRINASTQWAKSIHRVKECENEATVCCYRLARGKLVRFPMPGSGWGIAEHSQPSPHRYRRLAQTRLTEVRDTTEPDDNKKMSTLKGQVVLVTGAAKRVGRGIALRLAREGARVAIHYNGSADEARATAAECGDAAIFQANLERVGEIERLFEDAGKHFGRIDGLVNNAARFTRIDPLQVTEADWDFIHSVNLKATFFCCQQGAMRMLEAGGGRIVNISSLGGLRPWAEHSHYCASKAGVIMLTKALAKAFAPKVTVNSVAPGVIPFGPPGRTHPESDCGHASRARGHRR